MAAEQRLPIFLLAFANEQPQSARFLRGLAQELSRLRVILEQAQARYQVVFYPNLTAEELLGALRTYRRRIALFHYGGHSNSYSLLLQSADGAPMIADSGGLAKLLAHQHGLHLLFLNGCANAAQAQGLLDAGIAVVVATSDLIDDSVAMTFAEHFYAALANDATIEEAFKLAEATVELRVGSHQRHLFFRQGTPPQPQPPWKLYYQDEAAIQWRLAEILHDPCWGLPPLPRLHRPAQPFRHLAWFRRAHAEIFFGRSAEIRALYDRIDDPESAPMILLYGQSGVGKSSLLEAGLLPRLERDYVTHYLRRDQSLGLTGSLENKLCARTTNMPLPTVWLNHERQQQKPLVVVLDQVEELFTRPQSLDPSVPEISTEIGTAEITVLPSQTNGSATELDDFLSALRQIFSDQGQRPKGKIILGFRKEYLAEIEERLVAHDLPHSKVFLAPLRKAGIIEAVTGVAHTPRLQTHYGLTVADELPDLIASELLRDLESPIAPTLQILLSKLWEQAVARSSSQPVFDQALYQNLQDQGILLRDFFDQSLQALCEVDAEAVDSGLLLDLLTYYTTAWGTAEQHSAEALAQRYAHQTPTRLGLLVQGCKDQYLLADPVAEQATPRGLPAASRLAHDALAPLVQERFARSEAPGQRARRLLESRVIDWRQDPQRALFSDGELLFVEQNQRTMRTWTADEEALVKDSQAARTTRQQQAEAERTEQARIRREQKDAERRERGTRKVLRATFITVAVASFLIALAFQLQKINGEETRNRNTSEQGATLALQQLLVDPLKSIDLAQQALPSADKPKPYIAQAEFALTQALNASLERVYLAVDQPVLKAAHVALGDDVIAVGGQGLRFVTYDLTQVFAATVAADQVEDISIRAVTWNSQRDRLLLQEADRLSIWQAEKPLKGAEFDQMNCATWRPKANQVLVCTGNDLYLWSYLQDRKEKIHTFGTPGADGQWSPDGRWLAAYAQASTEKQQELVIWNAATQHLWSGNELAINQTISNTPILDLEFTDNDHFLTWGEKAGVQLWTIQGKAVHSFGLVEDVSQGFIVTPDRGHVLVLLNSGSAQLYELKTGQRIGEFIGHTERITTAAWHGSGRYLATGSFDGTARIWDMTTGVNLITLSHPDPNSTERSPVLGMAWRPDGRLLTYAENSSFRLWDVLDQQERPLCTGTGREEKPACHATAQSFTQTTEIESARWFDNDTIITVDRDRFVSRLSRTTGEAQAVCDGAVSYTKRIWDQTGHRLLFLPTKEQEDGVVCELATGEMAATIAGPFDQAFWLDNQVLISRPWGQAVIVDATSGVTVTAVPAITTTVTAARRTATGYLALATDDDRIHLWRQNDDGSLRSLVTAPFTLTHTVDDLQWSADGNYLLVVGRDVVLWDRREKQPVWTKAGLQGVKFQAAFSSDAGLIAIYFNRSFVVRETTSEKEWQPKEGHSDSIHGVQWFTGIAWPHQSAAHPLLASLARWLKGESWSVADNRPLLLTWSADDTARVWDWKRETEVMRMTERATTLNDTDVAAISPDHAHIFTANSESNGEGLTTIGRIWPAWYGRPDELLQEAQSRVTR